MLARALERRCQEVAGRVTPELRRHAILDAVDEAWTDHLEALEHLREGIGWEACAQQEPWTVYQLRPRNSTGTCWTEPERGRLGACWTR
ncbi:MAG: hypothetical protein AB1758_17560 [Candidatus Eremiobacterota bacterium]